MTTSLVAQGNSILRHRPLFVFSNIASK